MTGTVYSQQDISVLLYLGILLVAAGCLIAVVGAIVGRLMDRRTRSLDAEWAALDRAVSGGGS